MAFISISLSPSRKTSIQGLRHTDFLGSPGEELSCEVGLDDNAVDYRKCMMHKFCFGQGQIVLSQDREEIEKIMSHKKISVYLEGKNKHPLKPLEFDVDLEALKKAQKELYEFF